MKLLKKNRERKPYPLRHAVPVAVWLMSVALVVWLFHIRGQRIEVMGIAQGQIREIAADSTARIRTVNVELFQPVKAGDVLAVVDTLVATDRTLEAELKTKLRAAAAEAEHLAAELVAETSDREITLADSERRFAMDVSSAHAKILELRATIAMDQITAGEYAMEVKNCEDLLKKNAIVPYELEKAKAICESMSAKIKENQSYLEEAQAGLKQAEARQDDFTKKQSKHPSVDSAAEAVRKKIGAQEELVNGLTEQLETLRTRRSVQLTSPLDGVIVSIGTGGGKNDLLLRAGEHAIRRAGEVVSAGDPIVAVADKVTTEVVAYVSERALGRVREGMPVDLIKTRMASQIGRTTVARLGQTIQVTPQRLWRSATIPEYGLPIVIHIPEGLDLIPGEMVGVRGL
jgi:multidrug resistance efflux pump